MAQTHDIDDVLSSIRRLVANDASAAPKAADPAPEPEAPALVLAPAQRVTDPEDPFQMIRTLAQAERDARDAEHFVEQIETEVADIVSDISSQESRDALWQMAQQPTASASETGAADYTEDADYDAPQGEDAPEPALRHIARRADMPLPDMAEAAPTERVTPAPADPPAAPSEEAPTAGVTHLHRLRPRTAPEPTPEAPAEVTAQPAPAAPTPQAEAGRPAPSFGDSDGDDEGPVDLGDVADAVTTDDALRNLIAEIVRQELSGPLGERITRNVRKLVRREVRQMLSSGEYD